MWTHMLGSFFLADGWPHRCGWRWRRQSYGRNATGPSSRAFPSARTASSNPAPRRFRRSCYTFHTLPCIQRPFMHLPIACPDHRQQCAVLHWWFRASYVQIKLEGKASIAARTHGDAMLAHMSRPTGNYAGSRSRARMPRTVVAALHREIMSAEACRHTVPWTTT